MTATSPDNSQTPKPMPAEGFKTADFWLAYVANFLVMAQIALFYRFGDLVNHLGGSDRMLGLVVAIGSLVGLAARASLNRSTSRFGLHLAWMASIASMTVGAALVTFVAWTDADGISSLLFVGRVLYASGAAGGLTLPLVFVQKTTAAERRSEAVGFASGGVFLGMMSGAALSELVFLVCGKGFWRFPVLFGLAALFGVVGLTAVAVIRRRDTPLAFEALPDRAPQPQNAETAPRTLPTLPARRWSLLLLSLATGFAFTFLGVYLTRYLAVKQLGGGYLYFFFAYCASAFLIGYATKDWGRMIGQYRVALLGAFAYVFGILFFLNSTAAWHLVFPAVFCGIARAMVGPALVGLAENADARTVKGSATNHVHLAYDLGFFLGASFLGVTSVAFGYETTIAIAAAVIAGSAGLFAWRERASGASQNLKRRKDDFRSRRRSDRSEGQWTESTSRVSLVYVKTETGIRLDGALHKPANATRPQLGVVDAAGKQGMSSATQAAHPSEIVLMIHADGDDFTSPSILETVQNLFLEQGRAVLRINTSGKGVVNYYNVHKGAERHGTVYEIVHDCLGEIDTWIAWLRRQGYERVTLVGHRLGAVKALYYGAEGVDAKIVKRIVALSPPRLSHAFFLENDPEGLFVRDFAEAQKLLKAGKPLAYFEASYPAPDLTSAQTYYDKYGPEERYNVLAFARKISCPALFMMGSLEERGLVVARGLTKDLRLLADDRPNIALEVVAGANCFYSNVREKAVIALENWLTSQQTQETSKKGGADSAA